MASVSIYWCLEQYSLSYSTRMKFFDGGINEELRIAGEKIAKIPTEQSILTSFGFNVPPSAHYKQKTGNTVSAYFKRRKWWIGNLWVVEVDDSLLWTNHGTRAFRLHRPKDILRLYGEDAREIIQFWKQLTPFQIGSPFAILILNWSATTG